jgi:hypothetical protein
MRPSLGCCAQSPLQQGHVIIEVTNVLPTCQLKPPCPSVFDDQEKIRKGEFHSWPLTSVALPLVNKSC